MKKILPLLMVAVSLFMLCTGCQKKSDSENEAALTGTWYVKDEEGNVPVELPSVLTLRSTGYGLMDNTSISYKVTGSRIYVYIGTDNQTWSFSLSGDTLTLSTLSEKITYTKK